MTALQQPRQGWVKRTLRRPTTWISGALLVSAGALTVVSRQISVASDWWPNLATMTIEIAATITVVEWLVGRERRERLQPRTERTYYWLGLGIRTFAGTVMHDYAVTHAATYRGIPDDILALIDQWQEDHQIEDIERRAFEEDGKSLRAPVLVLEAVREARKLNAARERDLDVMPPELVRAIDDFSWAAAQAIQLCEFGHHADADTADHFSTAAATVVQYWGAFARSYFDHGDSGWREIFELSRRAMDQVHEHTIQETACGG